MFRDRQHAGQRLAEILDIYRNERPLILAIPRGGVEVGYRVAKRLDADLAVLVIRKLPLPRNPEAGFGAIAEDGSHFMFEHMVAALQPTVVAEIIEQQKLEIQRRVDVLRGGEPLPEIEGRTVILVDDGIAMGSTIRAAIAMCRKKQAKTIIVAAPVASPSTAEALAPLADDVVIVETPPLFRAVAQVYEDWYDVPDEDVVGLMREFTHQRV
jgi:putative phosphoribosyl transferase